MHDYTAGRLHEDRTAQFRREADASRLAREARHGQLGFGLPARIRGIAGLVRTHWTAAQAGHGTMKSSPLLRSRAAGAITPRAD